MNPNDNAISCSALHFEQDQVPVLLFGQAAVVDAQSPPNCTSAINSLHHCSEFTFPLSEAPLANTRLASSRSFAVRIFLSPSSGCAWMRFASRGHPIGPLREYLISV